MLEPCIPIDEGLRLKTLQGLSILGWLVMAGFFLASDQQHGGFLPTLVVEGKQGVVRYPKPLSCRLYGFGGWSNHA